MTIRRVEAFPLRYPEPHDGGKQRCITLVRVTDAEGVEGWGECISQWPEAALAVRTVVEAGLRDVVLGRDPSDPAAIWRAMREHAFWHGEGGIVSFAISAIDIAVWDLAGKRAGLPVHRLLGGRLVDRVPACASVILNTTDLPAMEDEFAAYRDAGYRWVKGGWGLVAEAGFGTDANRDVQIAALLRSVLGDHVGIALDVSAYAEWTPPIAKRRAESLREFDLAWLEDPLHHEDIHGFRELRQTTSIPLATGERCWTLADYRRLLRSGSIDIVLVDPGRVEGISAMKLIAAEAESNRVVVVPHSWSSAINTAAALHVFASIPNRNVFEIKPRPNPMQHELVDRPIEQRDGWITVDDRPGLGIEICQGTVNRYTFEA